MKSDLADRLAAARTGTDPEELIAGYTALDLVDDATESLTRAGVLPAVIRRIIVAETRRDPRLALGTPESVLGACLSAVQLGLEPGPLQHVHFALKWNRDSSAREVELIIGYRGFVELALRGGRTLSVDAHVVHQGDDFSYQYGTDPHLRHVPNLGDKRGPATCAYAVAQLREGGSPFIVLGLQEIDARRRRGDSEEGSPWDTDWDPMARKTCVRALAPYLPQTPGLAHAQRVDETVRTDIELELDEYEPPDADGREVDPANPPAGSDPGANPSTTEESSTGNAPESQDAGPGGTHAASPAPATGARKKPPPSKRAKA